MPAPCDIIQKVVNTTEPKTVGVRSIPNVNPTEEKITH